MRVGRKLMFLGRTVNIKRGISDFKVAEELNLTEEDSQFIVSETYGFLSRQPPLIELPKEFEILDSILKRAPIMLPDKSPGLLALGELGNTVEKELPVIDVKKFKGSRELSAILRDYSYLASMYLLEPCDISMRKTGSYGLARNRLPKQIAVPFTEVAKKLDVKPFLEYSNGYVGYNWVKKDPKGDMSPENLIIPRHFEGSIDEFWFQAIHLTMGQYSNELVKNTRKILKAVEQNNRQLFNQALNAMWENSQKINEAMNRMWERNQPKKYNDYRTFIMGSKNQPMFPDGIIYEGVSDKPFFFRGETGANDSMVPTLDNLFEVTAELPQNQLTEILKDFRSYRPKNHNDFLSWVEHKAKEVGVKKFAMKDPTSAVLMLANLDQIAEVRERHWRFTKEYIIRHSKHPVATGGSPITTWLPNQLSSVLKIIEEVSAKVDESKLSPEHRVLEKELAKRAATQKSILEREVNELKKRYPGQDI